LKNKNKSVKNIYNYPYNVYSDTSNNGQLNKVRTAIPQSRGQQLPVVSLEVAVEEHIEKERTALP
jgi:hypothetical protein